LVLIPFVLFLCTTAVCQYFPAEGPNRLNDFLVKWYSYELTSLHEPSLWELSKTSSKEVYRFLWLRTFHRHVAVRLTVLGDGTGSLAVKVAERKGFWPGKLLEDRTVPLSKEHVRWFLDGIDKANYWQLATEADARGCDGAEWILEGVKNRKYHIVIRWSPEDGPIRTLGSMLLFEMAHLKVPHHEIY
jgi:hypothetical protein